MYFHYIYCGIRLEVFYPIARKMPRINNMSFPGLFTLNLALSCMPAITATPCCNASSYSTQSHYEHVLSNYLNIWNGDLSLINWTFSPTISVHADRFPSPAGVGSVPLSATTSADFEAFVQRARNGWDKYTFVPYKWVAGENKIAVRWMLDAIMGANFTLAPT